MIYFTARILKFDDQGEKTGWTYIEIPSDIAQRLMPGNKKTFRVKGFLDQVQFEGAALLPMGEGDFILALNADLRKGIRKNEGAMLDVKLEADTDFKILPAPELMECLEEDSDAFNYFNSLSKSHREYFLKWINSAKTEPTREKRIISTLNAMTNKQDYGQMIRSLKQNK